MVDPKDVISPGDILLYSRSDWASWVVRVKTGSKVTHCEMAWIHDTTLASRPKDGVDTFALETHGLYRILRSKKALNLNKVHEFHLECRGQFYDWVGLLRFFAVGGDSDPETQFCSEYLMRLARVGGVDWLARDFDPDLVYPGMLEASPELYEVWRSR
jgi:hypothetical protein